MPLYICMALAFVVLIIISIQSYDNVIVASIMVVTENPFRIRINGASSSSSSSSVMATNISLS